MVVNYTNGKIYKITGNGCTYIGSTAQPYLSNRLGGHLKDYRRYLNGKYHYVTSFKCFETNDYQITLIESYPCSNKAELQSRERYHIELNKDNVVNKCVPGRSQKEYKKDNKEFYERYMKQYRIDNKDIISSRIKQYQHDNKEKISKRNKQVINCECTRHCTYNNLAQHKRSKFHKDYIELCNLCK